MGRLSFVKPRLQALPQRIQFEPKKADSFYLTGAWSTLRKQCLDRDGWRCVCGAQAVIADHIVSRRNGGADDLSNLRAMCRSCDNKHKEAPNGKRRGVS